MPVKQCEVCGSEFQARLSKIRTCGIACRNRLISTEKSQRCISVKQCVVCNQNFEVGAADAKRQTCSSECSYRLRASKTSKAVQRTCPTCGGLFEAKLSQTRQPGGGTYCSTKCLHDRNKAQTQRLCEACGTLFASSPGQMRVKTCSPECGYQIRADTRPNEKALKPCRHCQKPFEVYAARADQRTYCSQQCAKDNEEAKARMSEAIRGEKNPVWKGGVMVATVSATGKSYRRTQPHIEQERTVRRKRAKNQASPAWADKAKVLAFYMECAKQTSATGIAHHVDHIVPLQSKYVCGLHNEFNLQVIPAVDNIKKHNRHWPDKP